MDKVWIEAEIREGLFPNERLIIVRDFTGNEVGSFVPSDMIQHDGQRAEIEVQLLDVRDDLALILLPGEEAGPGNNILTISAGHILSRV